jgi:hypothetical protein
MEETVVLDLRTRVLGELRFTLSAGPIGSKSCCTVRISGVNGEDGGKVLEGTLTKKLVLNIEDLELKEALAGTTFEVPDAASWIAESAILAEHIQTITYQERNEAWNMKVTNLSDFYGSFMPVARELMGRARKACLMGHISNLSRSYRRAGAELDVEDLVLAWKRPIVREIMES